ncbi:Translation initiation factor 3 subunit c, partial [Coelomomyces lativittatus]
RSLEPEQRRNRWIKVATDEPKVEDSKKTEPKVKAEKDLKKTKPSVKETKLEKDTKTKDAVAELIGEVNPTNILSKLALVMVARGRKGSDREVIIMALQQLHALATLPHQKIKILFSLVSYYFDTVTSTLTTSVVLAHWKLALTHVSEILDVIEQHPYVYLMETAEEMDELALIELEQKIQKQSMSFKNSNDVPESCRVFLKCSLIAQLERLDDEFLKLMQGVMEAKSMEYRDRLRDEIAVYHQLLRAEHYFRSIQHVDALHRVLLRRIEHLYGKRSSVVEKLHHIIYKKQPNLSSSTSIPLLELFTFLYHHGDDRARTRTVLCHVYHHAIHRQYYKAKEMLLMSHVQSVIYQADPSTQALFNRVLLQLGLAAFLQGQMKDSYTFLHGLVTSGRLKELLGVGPPLVAWDVIDVVYFTASMFLEVPNMAGHPFDQARRHVYSKPFRKTYEIYEKNGFHGPAESDMDALMGCTKALFQGHFQQALDMLLHQVSVWKKLEDVSFIHAMLATQLRHVALVTWMYHQAHHVSSLSVTALASHFQWSVPETMALVSKMLKQKELLGHYDGVNDHVMLTPAPTKLQFLSHHLAEKLVQVSELHEKIYEAKVTVRKTGRGGGSGGGGGGTHGHGGRGGMGHSHLRKKQTVS